MKILITTDLFSTETNGVVTSVKNLRDELTRRGHDVRILTVSDSLSSHQRNEVSYICSISLKRIYPDVRMPVLYRHPYIRALMDWKPDVIHTQSEFFSFQFARHIAKKTGAPIVHTYHTLYEQYVSYVLANEQLGRRFVGILSRKRLEGAARVIAPTRKVLNTLRAYGVSNQIVVIPSGISLAQHQKRLKDEERSAKRKRLGINDHQTVLLNLGRLGTEKNLTELLHLFCSAKKEHDALVFLVVGDGPARAALESEAKKLGIADHVIFTGMVAPCAVQEYYQLGDVFVSASTSETQGLTYIEAAANGLPLLCREDPCLLDVLIPGENGYTYQSESEFLTALHAMLDDADWMAAAGERSMRIAAGFDKRAFGDAIEAVYQDVLREAKATQGEIHGT